MNDYSWTYKVFSNQRFVDFYLKYVKPLITSDRWNRWHYFKDDKGKEYVCPTCYAESCQLNGQTPNFTQQIQDEKDKKINSMILRYVARKKK